MPSHKIGDLLLYDKLFHMNLPPIWVLGVIIGYKQLENETYYKVDWTDSFYGSTESEEHIEMYKRNLRRFKDEERMEHNRRS